MNTTSPNPTLVLSAIYDQATIRRRKWRMIKDKIAQHSMTIGGISVIIAIVLIFFYLLYVVFPLLLPATMEKMQQFSIPAPTAGKTRYLAAEEQNEVGVRFTDQARVVFFKLTDGSVIAEQALPLPAAVTMTQLAIANLSTGVIALGLSDGRALVIKQTYDISYPNGVKVITPGIKYPLGEEPIVVDKVAGTKALRHLAVQLGETTNTLAAITADNRLVLTSVVKEISFLDESVTLKRTDGVLSLLLPPSTQVTHLLLDKPQRFIYVADSEGYISRIDISDKKSPHILERIRVVKAAQAITALKFLTGDISLLVGDSSGKITQWFPARDANNNKTLRQIREFNHQTAPIVDIAIEERRKGFVAADNQGQVGIYHSTAHRTLLVKSVTSGIAIQQIALTPRADRLLVEDEQGRIQLWKIHNEHPEISWSALWSKVWYESYDQPEYIWQSSSASNDFEPKFSLTPLAFGTLKAAFYAMIIATPLAILGAIYTAYFMAAGIRKIVKPTIEIMAALPTVILGFLAGLWLAPMIEANLPGVFLLFLLLPSGVLLFAYGWNRLPRAIRYVIPDGWQSTLLIPILLLITWIAFELSHPLEKGLFNSNLPNWLTTQLGIAFDQRNAIVVGIAMGLAVIPNIFSIAEDAIFSVPKHLTMGSLALGATPWQTMTRVVILTASPGIFSAVMIGMGRAIGETMIVLMATGNTPIMDFSIFQGLRTLAANIAVEMPESEVNSTHYRILFLAGLILFIFTFFFNTIAEIVRHRLRRQYSSL
ncbi:MAG: ABC transporter permease subunit [Thioploca sp.]|nr:ABC transporter permease subunit [Thioploca sp.]